MGVWTSFLRVNVKDYIVYMFMFIWPSQINLHWLC